MTTRHDTTSGARRRRLGTAAGTALLLVAISAQPAGAAAGALDPSFGTGGASLGNINGGQEIISASAVQPDGKIVSAGLIGPSSTTEFSDAAFVARHHPDGTLDASFDGDGIALIQNGSRLGIGFYGVTLQGDGKIVAVGSSGGTGEHLIVRYNTDGTLDATFGEGDGMVFNDVDPDSVFDIPRDVAVDDTGRIITVGADNNFGSTGSNFDFSLLAYTPDGVPDSSWGGDGMVTTEMSGGGDRGYAIALQSDGRVLAAGTSSANFGVVRYNSDGTLDTSFSGDGKATIDFGGDESAVDVAVDANDRIVVAGRTRAAGAELRVLAVVRLTSAGLPDTTFSGDGKTTAPAFETRGGQKRDLGLVIQADGKPVVGGERAASGSDTDDFGTARFTVGGSLDTTFSGDGIVRFDHAAEEDWGNDVVLSQSGNIVVTGGRAIGLDGSHHDGVMMLVSFQSELPASACPGMTITNTVVGTPGDDTLVGTPGSDFIYGLGGNDTITGGDGDDCIYGGAGDDVIDAGTGNDRIFAESGNDILTGGTGLDKVVGGPGDDTIRIAAGDVPAASTEGLKGKAGTDTVELGVGLSTTDVTGVPPTFSVNDPTTGGTFSAVKVEVVADT